MCVMMPNQQLAGSTIVALDEDAYLQGDRVFCHHHRCSLATAKSRRQASRDQRRIKSHTRTRLEEPHRGTECWQNAETATEVIFAIRLRSVCTWPLGVCGFRELPLNSRLRGEMRRLHSAIGSLKCDARVASKRPRILTQLLSLAVDWEGFS